MIVSQKLIEQAKFSETTVKMTKAAELRAKSEFTINSNTFSVSLSRRKNFVRCFRNTSRDH